MPFRSKRLFSYKLLRDKGRGAMTPSTRMGREKEPVCTYMNILYPEYIIRNSWTSQLWRHRGRTPV